MSTDGTLALDLSEGSELEIDRVCWTVRSFEPHRSRLTLVSGGREMCMAVGSVVSHPALRQRRAVRDPVSLDRVGRQRFDLADLTEQRQAQVRLRVEHMLEAETGYRSGDPRHPGLGEPKALYDPERTSLVARRKAKVAELKAMNRVEAEMLCLDKMSYRTLERLAAHYWPRESVADCIDGRDMRTSGGHYCMTPQLREAIFAVFEESLHRSRLSMTTKAALIGQYLREKHGPEVQVPSYFTLRRIWHEWFGNSTTRQRYARSAAAAAARATGEHVLISRPGQVVALDTTELPVMVREGVFGEPIRVNLTLALDVYTRSIVAFRLTPVSDTSIDVAMVLLDVMMPLPMCEGWGEEMEWPYPGIPAVVVAGIAGHKVAGLPFFSPETVTTDHGTVYKNHDLVEAQRVIGTNILPARVLRPTDKQTVERIFGSVRTLLFEYLPGYKGVDSSDRGADIEGDAVLTIDQVQRTIAAWVVSTWQNRALGEHAPAWDPGGAHSPNTLFAASMEQGGFALQVPSRDMYFRLLPFRRVKVHGPRGIKIKGLWYNGPALDPYRDTTARSDGERGGKLKVHRDPRDRTKVFVQDPQTHEFHLLRWSGLPPEGVIPAFGDRRVEELLAAAAERGLKPRTDQELYPLLLGILGGQISVEQWPTQKGKRKRGEIARDISRFESAAADQRRAGLREPTLVPAAAEPSWPEAARTVSQAVDDERRARRQQALEARPAVKPAPQMGAASRLRLILSPTGNDSETHTDESDR